jgi:hypothetical protein
VSQSTPEEFTFDVVPFAVACLGAWLVWPYNSLLRQLIGFVLAVYIFFWICRFIILLVTALRLRKSSHAVEPSTELKQLGSLTLATRTQPLSDATTRRNQTR